MIQRHALSDVHGGSYVFPGGKVDPADARLDFARAPGPGARTACTRCCARRTSTPRRRPRRSTSPAVREVFEECGLLFAQGLDGESPAAGGRAGGRRRRLQRHAGPARPAAGHARAQALVALDHAAAGAVVAGQALRHALLHRQRARRPGCAPRRARSRAQRLAAPARGARKLLARRDRAGAAADHEPGAPGAAIRRRRCDARRGRQPPALRGAAAAPSRSRARAPPPTPATNAIRSASRVMPGPLRLVLRGKRLEPPDGFDGLWR